MKTMLILLMLANAGDAALTMRNRSEAHCYELNPVLRPVFERGRPMIGITFAAGGAGEWLSARRFGRHHSKLAKIALGAALAGEAWGVAESAKDKPVR